ncbi:PDLI2 protein, partial [Urocolius indicus]|nr:PDLI2 protein [Urocolius indicus]
MPVTLTLPGPAPWGFRISGGRDFGKPITVSKVTELGKAAAGDLRLGDVIVTINGESTAEMLNVEAQNKIKQSPGQLQLQVERWVLLWGGGWQPGPPTTRRGLWSIPLGTTRAPGQVPASPGCLGGDGGSVASGHAPPSPPASLPPWQERGSLSCQILPPPPRPPSPELRSPPNPWEMFRERRRSSPCPSPCSSLGSDVAMRRLEEDSEVYKMLQENRELRAAPRQSSTFRLLQEALEDEEGSLALFPTAPFPSWLSPGARRNAPGVPKLHVCEKCGGSIATQAVRIQDGRYRHPSCYACADCGLNLKMRGHFWVGDELYCEKHARLRYQGPPAGVTTSSPISPHS